MDRAEIVARLAVTNGYLPPAQETVFVREFRAAMAKQPALLPEQFGVGQQLLTEAQVRVLTAQAADSTYRCKCGWSGNGRNLAVIKNKVICKACGQETIEVASVAPPLPLAALQARPTPTVVAPSDTVASSTVLGGSTNAMPRTIPAGDSTRRMSGSRNLDQLAPGTVIEDVRIERKVGQGGMGVVYRATDIRLDRPLALKILSPDLLENKTQVARFETEAKVLARLEHPNVVQVYRMGEIDGRPYLLMQWVDGESVADRLKRQHGGVPVHQAVDILLQAARGLSAAHDKGIIHRDVKPDNLLATKDGVIKVADFGLAKQQASDQKLSRTGAFMGTPAYAAPEQIEGQGHITPRTDIYSLGITAYHVLTGRLPFAANSLAHLLMQHVNTPLPSPRTQLPNIPMALDNLVRAMAAKKPHERPGSMADVARELESIAASLPSAGQRGAVGAIAELAVDSDSATTAAGATVAESVPEIAVPSKTLMASREKPEGVPSMADAQFDSQAGVLVAPRKPASMPASRSASRATPPAQKDGFKLSDIPTWGYVLLVLSIGYSIFQALQGGGSQPTPVTVSAAPKNTAASNIASNTNTPPKDERRLPPVTLARTRLPNYRPKPLSELNPRIVGSITAEGAVVALATDYTMQRMLVAAETAVTWYDAKWTPDQPVPQKVRVFFDALDLPRPIEAITCNSDGTIVSVLAKGIMHVLAYDRLKATYALKYRESPFSSLAPLPYTDQFQQFNLTPNGTVEHYRLSPDGLLHTELKLPSVPLGGGIQQIICSPDASMVAAIYRPHKTLGRLVLLQTRGASLLPFGVSCVIGGQPVEDPPNHEWVGGKPLVVEGVAPHRLYGFSSNARYLLTGTAATDADGVRQVAMLHSLDGDTWTHVKELWSAPMPQATSDAVLMPDGQLAVVALADGTVRFINGADGKELTYLKLDSGPTPTPRGPVLINAFDGDRLFIGYGDKVYLVEPFRE